MLNGTSVFAVETVAASRSFLYKSFPSFAPSKSSGAIKNSSFLPSFETAETKVGLSISAMSIFIVRESPCKPLMSTSPFFTTVIKDVNTPFSDVCFFKYASSYFVISTYTLSFVGSRAISLILPSAISISFICKSL